jgi:hypothetical protein
MCKVMVSTMDMRYMYRLFFSNRKSDFDDHINSSIHCIFKNRRSLGFIDSGKEIINI